MAGLNTEVAYKHETYHIQTQDKGPGANYVETIIYKGGRVLSSRRAYYTSLLNSSDLAEKIEDFVKVEHETAITEVEQGKFAHL